MVENRWKLIIFGDIQRPTARAVAYKKIMQRIFFALKDVLHSVRGDILEDMLVVQVEVPVNPSLMQND